MQMVARDFENLCKSKFGSNSEFGSNSGSDQIINGGSIAREHQASVHIGVFNGDNSGFIGGNLHGITREYYIMTFFLGQM